MKRLESGVERAFGRAFGRSTARVEPAELAQKLVKEMDEHKVSSVSRVYVPNKFTVYLCQQDRDYYRAFERSLTEELEEHVLKHAQTAGLSLVAAPRVRVKLDRDLKAGQFGILAEVAEEDPSREESHKGAGTDAGYAPEPFTAEPFASEPQPPGREKVVAGPRAGLQWEPEEPAVSAEPDWAPAEELEEASGDGASGDGAPLGGSPGPEPPPAVVPINPKVLDTQDIPVAVASDLELARQTIVLQQGRRAQEFHKGRVVLGRARQVDFTLDDPNVSRRHAAVYWEGGRLFVKDLGSTNGTLLNGRPVTAGPVAVGDILTLGDSEVTVRVG